MPPANTKKLSVPLELHRCFQSNDSQMLGLALLLIPLQPPDGVCGFLPVYETVQEMRKSHPASGYIRLKGAGGAIVPALVYSDRASFPKQARGFLIAYGTIEAMREQSPAAEFFSMDCPWPLPPGWTMDKPVTKEFAAKQSPGSAHRWAEKQPEVPLGGLLDLDPVWAN